MTEINNEREQAVRAALAGVIDPELRRPITELNMVKSVAVAEDGSCIAAGDASGRVHLFRLDGV